MKEKQKERVIRLRIPNDIYLRYKVLCAKMDLSMPKQVTELISKFLEVQEKNVRF